MRLLGGINHIFMDGVFRQASAMRRRMVNEFRVVVIKNGFLRGNAGQDAFAAAGIAGKKMRFDKAFGKYKIRPGSFRV